MRQRNNKPCLFPGCGRRVMARGLCASHWRQDRAGEPLQAIRGALPAALPDDPDERAILLARTKGTGPTTRMLLHGVSAARPVYGPQVDAELVDAVHARARCKGEDGLSDLRYQSEADPWRAMCMVCPVRELCVTLGRASWGWGLYGGLAMVYGYIAAESPADVAQAG